MKTNDRSSRLKEEANYRPKVSYDDLPDVWDRAAAILGDTKNLRELWEDANQKIPGADSAHSILWGKIPSMIIEIERLRRENAKLSKLDKAYEEAYDEQRHEGNNS